MSIDVFPVVVHFSDCPVRTTPYPPGSYPETLVLVEEEGIGRIGGVESWIAIEGVASTAEAHESSHDQVPMSRSPFLSSMMAFTL